MPITDLLRDPDLQRRVIEWCFDHGTSVVTEMFAAAKVDEWSPADDDDPYAQPDDRCPYCEMHGALADALAHYVEADEDAANAPIHVAAAGQRLRQGLEAGTVREVIVSDRGMAALDEMQAIVTASGTSPVDPQKQARACALLLRRMSALALERNGGSR